MPLDGELCKMMCWSFNLLCQINHHSTVIAVCSKTLRTFHTSDSFLPVSFFFFFYMKLINISNSLALCVNLCPMKIKRL
uniref:Uncharacterized protein n=1 Tax=Anguilla anguilla TaxID=7936 RepID=A0A0E9W8T7_ANGAN